MDKIILHYLYETFILGFSHYVFPFSITEIGVSNEIPIPWSSKYLSKNGDVTSVAFGDW